MWHDTTLNLTGDSVLEKCYRENVVLAILGFRRGFNGYNIYYYNKDLDMYAFAFHGMITFRTHGQLGHDTIIYRIKTRISAGIIRNGDLSLGFKENTDTTRVNADLAMGYIGYTNIGGLYVKHDDLY